MNRLKALLESTGLPFAAYAWTETQRGDYGVYGLDSGYSMSANNRTAETAMQGTVDYFTRTDGEEVRKVIASALAPLPHRLNSVQYEENTGYLHLEWVVTMYADH